MPDVLTFEVTGSAGVIHTVVARQEGAELIITCTCDAGRNRMHCRHRTDLLAGDGASLFTPNTNGLEKLTGWLPGTKLLRRLKEVSDATEAHEAAKKKLAALKKALGREMEGG